MSNAFRAGNRDLPVASFTDLLLVADTSQEVDFYDSMATSPITNTQSSGFPSQVSSLSPQETIPGSEPLSFIQTMKPGVVGDKAVGAGVRNGDNERRKIEYKPGNGVLQDPMGLLTRSNTILQRQTEPTHRLDTTAGQKRTANGEIKSGSSISPVNRLDIPHMLDTSPQRSPQRSPQIGHVG